MDILQCREPLEAGTIDLGIPIYTESRGGERARKVGADEGAVPDLHEPGRLPTGRGLSALCLRRRQR